MNTRFLLGLAFIGGMAGALAWYAASPDHAIVSSHHPSGTNLAVRPLKDGRADRAWVTWYEDRWKSSEAQFRRGERTGTWRSYARPRRDEDGKVGQTVLIEAEFGNDELDGHFTRRFSTGEVREEGRYQRGLRHGEWTRRTAPDAPAETVLWWRGHELGSGPTARALLESLDRDPPADPATLEARFDAYWGER